MKHAKIFDTKHWENLKPIDLKKITFIHWDGYYRKEFKKNQIVIHHTVSGPGIRGDLSTWLWYKSKVATCIVIERDGKVNQLFSSKYYAYHLGCDNSILDKQSIGVELDNWGQLKEKNGSLYTIYKNKVDVPIVEFSNIAFRGQTIFEAYTEKQLKSLGELLLFWHGRYGIPLDYKPGMWNVSKNALSGKPGVWAHVSFRPWPSIRNKWDAFPDPNLIRMLKSISKL